MENIKVVLIDDEANCINALKTLLEENCNDIEIAGTANSAIEGIKLIQKVKPGIVFLDVDMPHGSGFDVLEAIPERTFEVIFVTAHNHYAVKAFKYSAIDYILKPVDIDELILAIEKVSAKKVKESSQDRYSVFYNNMKTNLSGPLVIPSSDKIEFVNPNDIIRIESDSGYSTVYFNDKTKIFTSKRIGEFQELLDEKIFYRIHKSHLVNIKMVKRYHNKDGGYIELKSGDTLPLARRNKSDFFEKLNNNEFKF